MVVAGTVRGRLFTTGRHSGTSLTMSRPLAGACWAWCWLLKVQAPMLRTPPTTRPVPPTSPPPALGPTNGRAGGRSGECGWSLAESGDMEPLHGPGCRSLLLSSACNLLAMTLKTYFLNPLIFWLLVVVNIFAKYFMQRLLCF